VDIALHREQLLPYLKQELGPKVELAAVEVLKRRHDYVVLKAQLRHPELRIVVKLAGPEAPLSCPFDRTAALHHLVAAQTTIPMPDVIAVDVSCQTWPWRIFIRTYCPGQEWATIRHQLSADELGDARRQIGDAVAQLHAVHFPQFGELDADGQIRTGMLYLAALRERSGRSITNPRHHDLTLSIVERRAHLFTDVQQACLCHEDLHGHNILFQPHRGRWRLATILDFDKAWSGHHEIDLARLELWRGMTSEGFWQAYQATHTIDPGYAERKPIYQLIWCLEYAQPTEQHLADTRRVCAELGLAPVEHFG
jgi:fructosamine-3-kinase